MKDVKDIAKRASAGAMMGGALVFTGGMGLAGAQPPSPSPTPSPPAGENAPPAGESAPPAGANDGLVDVKIADATILEDADLGTAAVVVAQICDVGMIPSFIEPVDTTGNSQEPCRIDPVGPVTVVQNTPGDPEGPAAEGATETSPAPTETSPTPTEEPTATETAPETTPDEAPGGQGN